MDLSAESWVGLIYVYPYGVGWPMPRGTQLGTQWCLFRPITWQHPLEYTGKRGGKAPLGCANLFIGLAVVRQFFESSLLQWCSTEDGHHPLWVYLMAKAMNYPAWLSGWKWWMRFQALLRLKHLAGTSVRYQTHSAGSTLKNAKSRHNMVESFPRVEVTCCATVCDHREL
jgi:hypothetical protein